MMTYNDIAAAVLDLFKYHISKDEIISAIARNKNSFLENRDSGQKVYSLSQESFNEVANADNRIRIPEITCL